MITADQAAEILDAITRRNITDTTPRNIWLILRRRYRSVAELTPALQLLERQGRLQLTEGQWHDVGIQARPVAIRFPAPSTPTYRRCQLCHNPTPDLDHDIEQWF